MKKKKPFNPKTHKKFDRPARAIVRKWLDAHGYYTLINPIEDYLVDILAIRVVNGISGPIKAHEVEVKEDWKKSDKNKTGEWPKAWKTLHIPERKLRLVKKYNFIFFWVISGDYRRAVVVDGKYITHLTPEEVKNKEFPEGGEYFYCIPISLCSKKNIEKFKEKK